MRNRKKRPSEPKRNVEKEIERFFKDFSAKDRQYVEWFDEYQIALKRGKVETALEIACAVLLSRSSVNEMRQDVQKIFRKAFPELAD